MGLRLREVSVSLHAPRGHFLERCWVSLAKKKLHKWKGSKMVPLDVSKKHAHDDNKKIRAKCWKYACKVNSSCRTWKEGFPIQSFDNPTHFWWNVRSFQSFEHTMVIYFIKRLLPVQECCVIITRHHLPPRCLGFLAINTGCWVERELPKPYWVMAIWVCSIEVNIL